MRLKARSKIVNSLNSQRNNLNLFLLFYWGFRGGAPRREGGEKRRRRLETGRDFSLQPTVSDT